MTKRKVIVLLITAIIVIGGAILGVIFLSSRRVAPHPNLNIPAAITSGLNFPIYYPNQSKLPGGYTLETKSFSRPINEGISYTVTYGSNQTIVFSLQPKPSSESLQTFEASYIPLRNPYQTPIGQAELGAYNIKGKTKTLVSLAAAQSNTWIIVTAPYNINQDQLKQILNSLQKY